VRRRRDAVGQLRRVEDTCRRTLAAAVDTGARRQPAVHHIIVVGEIFDTVIRSDGDRAEIEAGCIGDVKAKPLVIDDTAGSRTTAGDGRASVVFHLDVVVINVGAEIDQVVAGRIGIIGAVGLRGDRLIVGIGNEIIVVENAAELQRMLVIRRDFGFENAGDQIGFGVGNNLAIAVLVVARVFLADTAEEGDAVIDSIGAKCRFRPAGFIAAEGRRGKAAVVLAIRQQVFDIIGAQIGSARQSPCPADPGYCTTRNVDAADKSRIDIGKARGREY
jgi:hypothetical protein